MSGETTVTEGKTWDAVTGEVNNLAKLNLAAKPSVRVDAASIGDRELIDGSITSDKLATDVLAQINAEAVVGDGSITAAKIANGAVTLVKLNQDVLDSVVRRAVVTSTVGSYLKYSTTGGITEEVTLAEMLNDVGGEALAAKTTDTASPEANAITLSNNISALSRISGSVAMSVNHTSVNNSLFTAQYEFIKVSGSWTGSILGVAHGATNTSDVSTNTGTGTTSLATGNIQNNISTGTITVAISGTTLTVTGTDDVAVDAIELSATVVTQ